MMDFAALLTLAAISNASCRACWRIATLQEKRPELIDHGCDAPPNGCGRDEGLGHQVGLPSSAAQTASKGRDFAAWLGLVPRQHSTGGKPTLLGISKKG